MLRFILPSIFWTIFVIIMSLVPSSNVDFSNFQFAYADKVIHGGMYALLCLFWATALKKQNIYASLRRHGFRITLVGAFSLGFLLEVIQEFYTYTRHFELLDLLANGIGCIFGIVLFKLFYPNYNNYRSY